MSPIILRRAVADDAPAIAAVFDAAVRLGWTYLGNLVNDPMFTARDWDQLVAVDEADEVVGYTAVHPQDCEMFLLFVHPAHAGQGIGRTLLEAGHDALRAGGCREAFLFVHERNTRARAVYTAAGYRADGSERVSDFRGISVRELRMVKTLEGAELE